MSESLSTQLLSKMDTLIFQPDGEGALLLKSPLSDWLMDLLPESIWQTTPVRLPEEQFPFLENFMMDAETFWQSDETKPYPSGLWIEQADSGAEYPLEAFAYQFDDGPYLVLKMLGEHYLHNQQQLQKVRNTMLTSERLNIDLADTREDLADTKEQKEQAERASLAKSQFIASMSHEMRTPMNAILGFTQILEAADLDNTQIELLQHIHQSANHLLNLINEVLDISKIESGKVEIREEDMFLEKALDECLMLQKHIAKDKRVEIKTELVKDTYHLIHSDYTRVKQVLLNLINNAIKYNKPEGGSVTVRLRYLLDDASKEKRLKLEVKDTGIGIHQDYHHQVFQAYNRLSQEGSDIQGTGVGLSIIKDIVERLGWQIGFQSEQGVGSTFWIELPYLKTQSQKSSLEMPKVTLTTDSSIDKTILYVEDTPTNVLLVQSIVKRSFPNLTLEIAVNGQEGIEKAQGLLPDLILLDIGLPDMDGFEVKEHIQAIPACQHIPIIAFSANVLSKDVDLALASGFSDYITKPININDFCNKVIELLQANL